MFQKSHKTYNANAIQQKDIADRLFYFIKQSYIIEQNIIDIGCGTGFLGEKFLQINKNVCFADISSAMLAECKNLFSQYRSATFKPLDFNNYDDLKKNMSLDAMVVSNMSLQWAKDFFKTCQVIIDNSKIFAFSIPIAGSMSEWYSLLKKYDISFNKFNFITQEEVLFALNKKNIKYEIFDSLVSFDNTISLIKNFRKTGINCKLLVDSKNIKNMLKDKNTINCNYKILNCIVFI